MIERKHRRTWLARLEKAQERVSGPALRRALALPSATQRRLAGSPVVIDGQLLAVETQLLLRLKKLLREPGVETLPLPRARAAYTRQLRLVGGRQPIGATLDLEVDGADGRLPARLYVPRSRLTGAATAGEGAADPTLMFLHGGGMMYGDLDSYDATCRFLAEHAQVRVLSIGYRLAPEHTFPAAVEDCAAAYRWLVANAAVVGADVDRLAVGGDSAGGYLSATTALAAAREGLPCALQLLVYPVTDMTGSSESRKLFGEGLILTTEFIEAATAAYLTASDDRRDPLVSVLFTEHFPPGLAPAYVTTAGFDPLRDEGEAYAAALEAAGVPVETRRFRSLIHGFLCMVGVGTETRVAAEEVADALARGLR